VNEQYSQSQLPGTSGSLPRRSLGEVQAGFTFPISSHHDRLAGRFRISTTPS
jgi:hypothetical protein